MKQKTKLSLANPRGFCAGVDRAIEIVNTALDMFGSPIYVKHEVVAHKTVLNDFKERRAIFIEEISDVS
jgi:Penicillin tolerance protein